MRKSATETHSWFGRLCANTVDGIYERMERDFGPGTRVAVSCTGGILSPELRVETVEELKNVSDENNDAGICAHLIMSTNKYVMGWSSTCITEAEAHAEDARNFDKVDVEFSDDYRGRRMVTKQYNGYGYQLTWIFMVID